MNTDWGAVGSGALSGAGTGAAIGSTIAPGAGTAVGAGVGAGVGALVGGISGYFDGQSQLASEERAKEEYDRQFAMQNAEYDRRVADERAYNDLSAQAERLRQAGINPLSAIGNLSSVSNTAGDPGQPNAQASFNPARRSSPLAMSEVLSMMSLGEDLKAKKLDNEMRELNLIATDWDNKLKEQLYDYNSSNYPLLLKAGEQKLKNAMQEYKNLVAQEDYDTAQAELARKNALKVQEEIWILQLQNFEHEQQIEINRTRLLQMAQELERGEFEVEYAKWHAQHEKALAFISETQGKITEKEWQDLWESGLMKEKTEAEKNQIQATFQKLNTDIIKESSIWNTGDTSFLGQLQRYLLYLCTELI